ncbi:MAG: M28 family peptidase [Acidobacteriota bacterium]|jgi:hypothetical protein
MITASCHGPRRPLWVAKLIAVAAFTGVVGCAPAPPTAEGAAPAIDSIRQQDMRADLYFLASDAMNGRRAATRDVAVAAEFIKARFERLGLTPAGDGNSYFQDFDLAWTEIGDGDNSLLIEGVDTGGPRRRTVGQDYYTLNFSASGSAAGELVYAGFGIVDPRLGYDDYLGEDVTGKIVLVLDSEPGVDDPDSRFDGLITAEQSRDWRKALAAQARGAAGVLFVRDVHNRGDVEDYDNAAVNYWRVGTRGPRYMLDVWLDEIDIPAARISARLAERLVAGSGQSLEDLARSAESERGRGVLPLPGPQVQLNASVRRNRAPARNVLGAILGSDPELRNEVVIISAHFDHDGANEQGIYHGADDDGSGTVALLDIAEAYTLAAAQGRRPRRTVIFAAWDAEERGLLGAWYYTEAPVLPLGSTVAVLNMDMIGRNEEVPADGGARFRGLEPQTAESNADAINIMGYTHSSDLRNDIEQANGDIGLELKFRYDNNASQLLRRSDHWPFLQVGVPATFFHTGLHPDYHRFSDTPDRINYPKMEKIARLVYLTSWMLANDDGQPALDRDL